jgi:hypothetical protein
LERPGSRRRNSERFRMTDTHQGRRVWARPMGAPTQRPVARGIATSPGPVHCMLRSWV